MKCKYCNEEYMEEVFSRTGRCSECGELLRENTEKPKRASRYVKSTSIATEDVNKTQRMKETRQENVSETKQQPIVIDRILEKKNLNTSSADDGNTEQWEDEKNISANRLSNKSVSNVKPEIKTEVKEMVQEEISELELLGLGSFGNAAFDSKWSAADQTAERGYEEGPFEKTSKATSMELETLDKQTRTVKCTVKATTTTTDALSSKGTKKDEGEKEKQMPLFFKNLMENRKEEKEIRKKLMQEELEADFEFNFNADGFYNDTEPVVEARPDALSKTIFIKVIAMAVAIFLIITFMIYYA